MLGLRSRTDKSSLTLAELVDEFEKCVIEQAIADNKGDISAVMKALSIPRRTLNEKMRKHSLKREDYHNNVQNIKKFRNNEQK